MFLDDFVVYSRKGEYLDHLRLCLENCRGYWLSLKLAKCVLSVTSGTLLGHIMSKEGIAVDLDKSRLFWKHWHQQLPSFKSVPRADPVA